MNDLAFARDSQVEAARPLTAARLLVVDDEPANLVLLVRLLRMAGFREIATARDPCLVIDLVRQQQPDAILLDLLMPTLDGYALLTLLRDELGPETPLPILVMTADTSADARLRALNCGASDFLAKPFDPVEVRLRLENLLRTRFLEQRLHANVLHLEQRVAERTRELADRQARLEQLAREALTRADEAEAASQAKDDFLAMASHELRTPLTSLGAYLQIHEHRLERAAAPDDGSELVHRAQSQVSRLSRIVTALLDFAKLGRDQFGVSLTKLDLVALARDTVAAQELATPEHTLNLSMPSGPLWVRADADRIAQVVENLLENARTFAPRGSSIAIWAGRHGTGVQLSVQDAGIGIPTVDQERIFSPYQRGGNVDRNTAGLGLGLHIAREIVVAHGGTLSVTSSVGAGSIFTMALPSALAAD